MPPFGVPGRKAPKVYPMGDAERTVRAVLLDAIASNSEREALQASHTCRVDPANAGKIVDVIMSKMQDPAVRWAFQRVSEVK
jgi:hypothetical protein